MESYIPKTLRPKVRGSFVDASPHENIQYYLPKDTKRIIVIIATTSDPTAQYFSTYLNESKIPFCFINQALIGEKIHIYQNGFLLVSEEIFISFDNVAGILNRYTRVNPELEDIEQQQKMFCICEMFEAISNQTTARVYNYSYQAQSNFCKPYQLSSAETTTLIIPNFSIAANKQFTTKPGSMIFKSVSSHRSITTLQKEATAKVNHPTLFQQFIPGGKNIRVHVIENQCFPQLIESSAIDFRYPSNTENRYSDFDLPSKIKSDCLNLSKQFSLPMCGIDLMYDEGKFYLLEVNPAPGFEGFETRMETPRISKALAQVLSGEI